jgi:hypothetical protein
VTPSVAKPMSRTERTAIRMAAEPVRIRRVGDQHRRYLLRSTQRQLRTFPTT